MRILRPNSTAHRLRSDKIAIGALYFLLCAGGLWHVLGLFQSLMKILAAPLIITLAIMVFWQSARALAGQSDPGQTQSTRPGQAWFSTPMLRFYLWSAGVVVLSFFAEWLGVQTGWIFGDYRYENTLQPLLLGVPIAIGFAWLAMLLTTTAVAQRLKLVRNRPSVVPALVVASLMVVFDAVMEPAAVYLRYWTWAGATIPLQNYVAWFILSFLFFVWGQHWRIFTQKFPNFVFQAFFAQLIYFGLITLYYFYQ